VVIAFDGFGQLEVTHVPYEGGAATLTAVMGGEATTAFYKIETVLGHILANRLRALAVSTRERTPKSARR
jgi:tripartite-type tricarboxylate transporter receptor subunit TctC